MDLSSITPTLDMNSAYILANQTPTINRSGTKTEAQIRTSAQGFERILVRQMLSTMRNPDLRGDDDSKTTSSAYLEIADDNMADLLSKGQGIGLATKLAEQILQQANIKQLINNEKNSVTTNSNVNSGGNGAAMAKTSGTVSASNSVTGSVTNTVNL